MPSASPTRRSGFLIALRNHCAFDTRAPARILCAALIAALCPAAASQPPSHIWSHGFLPTPIDDIYGAYYWDNKLATNAAREMVIVGGFHGQVDMGGGPITSGEFEDILVAKYDAAGNHVWSRTFHKGNTLPAHSVDIDDAGNVVVVGAFIGSMDIGGVTLSSGFVDAFVAKYDPDGDLMWGQRFGITGPLGNPAEDVAFDSAGNIVFTGAVTGQMNFGGGVIQSFGGKDIFLVKLDPSGGHISSQRFGGAGNHESKRIVLDANDDVSIAGYFSGDFSLGGGILEAHEPFQSDIFLGMFTPAGAHIGSRVVRLGMLLPFDIWLGASVTGGVALAGQMYGDLALIEIGGAQLVGTQTFLATFDPTGTDQWHTSWEDQQYFVSFDREGHSFVSGRFEGTLDFGGHELVSVGGRDAFIARLDPSGATEWAKSFGGIGDDIATATVGSDGDVWAIGGYGNGIDFGGGGGLSGSGYFLVRFGEQPLSVLISSFDAVATGDGVQLSWELWSDESIDEYSIYRLDEGDDHASVVTTGPITGTTGVWTDTRVEPGRTYHYELVVRATDGETYRSRLETVTIARFATVLHQNFPNPFNPETTIEYTLGDRGPVSIGVFDAAGARVIVLEQGVREAGIHRVEWDGRDANGLPVGSGVYFYRLEGAGSAVSKKMVLLK